MVGPSRAAGWAEGPQERGVELGLALLAYDVGAQRMPPPLRVRRVRRAMAMGRTAAERIVAAHGTRDPLQLAGAFGVPVERRDTVPRVPLLAIRSEYYSSPPRIVLYTSALAEAEVRLQAGGRAATAQELADLHVAHELFHHLEDRQGTTVSRRLAYTRRRLGPFRWRVGVAALREVAAHAFAQALLRLPCHPLEIIGDDFLAPLPRCGELR